MNFGGYALLFADVSSGDPKTRARQARAFASFLVKENVSGVIFQPLEFLDDADRLNREIASILSPPLTTIRQPCKEIGATLFNRLMERIAKPDLLPAEILLPSPLVVRASTRRRGGRP